MNDWGFFLGPLGFHYFHQVHLKEVGLKEYPKSPNNIIRGSSCQGFQRVFSFKAICLGHEAQIILMWTQINHPLYFGTNEGFFNFCGPKLKSYNVNWLALNYVQPIKCTNMLKM
jgi:hypothetical protein